MLFIEIDELSLRLRAIRSTKCIEKYFEKFLISSCWITTRINLEMTPDYLTISTNNEHVELKFYYSFLNF